MEKTPPDSDPSAGSDLEKPNSNLRAEIDTSAPFESVREAVTRFGGVGFWKPISLKEASLVSGEGVDIVKLEEEAAELQKDLIEKERETLEVLKELEATRTVVEEFKVKLQNESFQVDAFINSSSNAKIVNHVAEVARTVIDEKDVTSGHQNSVNGLSLCPSSAPGFILMELKQAKLNLTRTTYDLADIRAAVETFNKKIEKERISIEKTRQRLSSNTTKISSLEEEFDHMNQKLCGESDNPADTSREIQRLTSEMEQFKKIGEEAKSEIFRATSEIEQTKARIKTTEIRLIAARKMKEAARASEALALSEMRALANSEITSPEGMVTLSLEEYSSLTSKAREAEESAKRRVMDAMLKVDEACLSNTEILKRVEEATEEVKSSKRVLEEALSRVEAANVGKLAVEEALRKWRSEHGQKRRSVHSSIKFKNSYPSHHRSNSRLCDIHGFDLVSEGSGPVLKPALSIGQILSRKLLLTEDFENGVKGEKSSVKRKISLRQMLSKPSGDVHSGVKGERESSLKQLPPKRKKFGFGRISFLAAAKPSKKKKKHYASRLSCAKINY